MTSRRHTHGSPPVPLPDDRLPAQVVDAHGQVTGHQLDAISNSCKKTLAQEVSEFPAAIPWTPEKAAFALGNVKVTPFDATTGLRCVGKNSLAEAIKGNISRTGTTKEGKVIWINIIKRDNCQLPLPDIYSAKLEGGDRTADVFEAQDVPDAIHKLVGAKDAVDFFGSALFVAALKQCMERCGLRDLSTLDQVVAEVAARASKTQEQLESSRSRN